MYRGMTLINDPRVSESGFYKQMMETKPNVSTYYWKFMGEFSLEILKENKKRKRC